MKNERSRRHFLKTCAATALAGGALAQQSWQPPPRIENKLGVALVGLGYYSTDVLAPALQQTRNCALTGIVTGTAAKERIWSEKYGIPRRNIYNYDNYDRIVDNDEIDIIYVVLPNSMHAEYTIRAARAGKHVICEKPMALSVAECESMIRACRDNGRMLSIGYRMQFEPHTREAMRFGREKVFGEVRYVTASAGFQNGSPKTHWKLQKAYGGGALMDMGVYSIQGARYVIHEEPVSVTAQSFTVDPERFDEVDETVTLQLEFPSQAMANLMTSFRASANILYASAQKGWFSMNPFSGYRGIKLDTIRGPVALSDINQQATQMDEVAWCIVNNEPMRVPGEEGLRDLKIIEATREALRSGRKVAIA